MQTMQLRTYWNIRQHLAFIFFLLFALFDSWLFRLDLTAALQTNSFLFSFFYKRYFSSLDETKPLWIPTPPSSSRTFSINYLLSLLYLQFSFTLCTLQSAFKNFECVSSIHSLTYHPLVTTSEKVLRPRSATNIFVAERSSLFLDLNYPNLSVIWYS